MTQALREKIARIIAPTCWAVMDGFFIDFQRKYKGQNVGYPEDQFWHKDSLKTADAILALPELQGGGDEAGLREAMKGACDLLIGRTVGSPARSARQNARLVLKAALKDQPLTTPAPEAPDQGRDAVAWLIEESHLFGLPGSPLYVHRYFDARRWHDEAHHVRNLNRRKEPFHTKDANEAMRFDTKDHAEAWLAEQPRFVRCGGLTPREHCWPSTPAPATSIKDHLPDADWLRRKVETDPDLDVEALTPAPATEPKDAGAVEIEGALLKAINGGLVSTKSSGDPNPKKRSAEFSIKWYGDGSLGKCDAFYDAFLAQCETPAAPDQGRA